MKKKSCRMTDSERSIHDAAVRVRKMTDAQLVEHIEHLKKTAYAAGYDEASKVQADTGAAGKTVGALIEQLNAGACKGIRGATAYKIAEFARNEGYIE